MQFVWAEEELLLEVLPEIGIPLDGQQDEPCRQQQTKGSSSGLSIEPWQKMLVTQWALPRHPKRHARMYCCGMERGLPYCGQFNLSTTYLKSLDVPSSLQPPSWMFPENHHHHMLLEAGLHPQVRCMSRCPDLPVAVLHSLLTPPKQ